MDLFLILIGAYVASIVALFAVQWIAEEDRKAREERRAVIDPSPWSDLSAKERRLMMLVSCAAAGVMIYSLFKHRQRDGRPE